MSRVLIIAKRELSSLFVSPIGYLVLFLFLLFMGFIFVWRIFVPGQIVDLRDLADFSRFALFFIIPLLTMSFFSDEYRSGRIEMLRTSPISEFELLLGKFLGAMAFYVALLASTLIYLIVLLPFGRPDLFQLAACYLGMLLMGCMFVAVGLFFSSCTKEPIVAALGSIITLGALTISSLFTRFVPGSFDQWGMHIELRSMFNYLTVGTHIGDFARGSVELTNIMYFLGLTGLFLFWTYLLLESKNWR